MPTAPTTDETTTPRREATVADSWTALAAWAADELSVRLAFDGKEYRFEPSDPAPPAECTELEIPELGDDQSVFCVYLTDAAGNTGPGDCTAPVTIISTDP